MPPLSIAAINAARPTHKPMRLSDGRNMYLLLNPDGSKWWRLDYRVAGKRKTISLGTYPDITLKAACDRCDDARRMIAEGIDPSAKRQGEKEPVANTFEAVAREWFTKFAPNWAKGATHSSSASMN
jgi:hypothetical protein